MKTKPAKLIYFLGAGAAKPCGYLTTPELYKALYEERGDLALLQNFADPLNEAAKAQPIDIEVLYGLVSQNVANITKAIYGQFDSQSLSDQLILEVLRRHSEWGDTLSQLSEAFEECRTAILEFIRQKFWAIAPDCTPYHSLEIPTAAKKLGPEDVLVFTTNYDPSIEDYLQQRVLYTRGLVGDTFDPKTVITGSPSAVRLVQLHGAIDLYQLKDGRVVRINSFQMPGPWRGGHIEGPYLVPPAMGKITYSRYQKILLNFFSSSVNDAGALVVIGFSFRDEDLARALANAPSDCEIFIACGSNSQDYLREWFSNRKTPVTYMRDHYPNQGLTTWVVKNIERLKQANLTR